MNCMKFLLVTLGFPLMAHPHEASPQAKKEEPHKAESFFSDSFFHEDSWARMKKMREQVMKDFDSFHNFGESFLDFNTGGSGFIGSAEKYYTLNSKETEDHLIFEIKLESNIEGDTVNISVENGMVTISGKKMTTNKNEDDMESFFFSSSSSFTQSFSVPSNVDSANVKIRNEKNKIILTFPKMSQEI